VTIQTLAHGVCALLPLDAAAEDAPQGGARLLPAEQSFARELKPRRRATWVGGRLALAAALEAAGFDRVAVLATPRGAPALPDGVVGSVSHKRALAAALVAPDTGWHIGVDIEAHAPARPQVAARVLTVGERAALEGLCATELWEAVLVRFSLKEALYKALDPFVERFVGFQEAQVTPRPDGAARVELSLEKGEGPFVVEARWQLLDAHVLTTCRVRPA
jgi:phosphopantetheine--protein transferase-like protein